MELPEELLQLQDFQKQRRERAAKEYRVNAQGLLIRTVLQPKEPAAPTAGKEEQLRGFLCCKTSDVDKAPHFVCQESHRDKNFLDKQTTAKSQIVSPMKGDEANEESEGKPVGQGPWGREALRPQKAHLLAPSQGLQTHFSLKDEIEQLLMVENKGALPSSNQDPLGSSSLPQETWVAPPSTSPLPERTLASTLPPCPALEQTDSWISPSLNLF